jgi:branched-chain amino acid transport system substrate-binding protein
MIPTTARPSARWKEAVMNRREFLVGPAALLAGSPLAHAQGAREVVVGAVYPVSGPNAQIGVDAKTAMETVMEIVNNASDLDLPTAKNAGLEGLGGAKLRVIFADHQGDPQKGRAEAERLITQEKVCAIVGAFHSSVSSTVSIACERYKIPYVVADSTSPNLNRRNLSYFFRTTAHDEMFTIVMFDFLDALKAKGQPINTVGLVYEDTQFGTDSSAVQRRLAGERGYKVVSDIKYRSSSPSLTAEVQMIKNANPDVLMPSSYTTDAILLVKTMGELGYRPKNIVAQAAGFAEKAVYDSVGDQLQGLISRASFSLDLAVKRPSVGKVNDMFKAKASRDLNDNTSRQFMALLVLADAIDRAKSVDGGAIRDALAATDIPGERTIMPWKRVKFGPDGQNYDADPVLIQYEKGKWVTVFPEQAAVAAAQWPMNKT